MNAQEARKILEMYRPGGLDAEDPRMAEALSVAQQDQVLREWFESQQSFDRWMSEQVRAIPVPSELKAAILARKQAPAGGEAGVWRKWQDAILALLQTPILPPRGILIMPFWRRWPGRVALAGACALAAAVVVAKLTGFQDTFARYRGEVVEDSWEGERHVDLVSSDLGRVREWLRQKNAGGGVVLPVALADASVKGCRLLEWRGRKVAYICLMDGPKHLHLFVADRNDFPDAPPPEAPQFEKSERWQTASWTQGNHAYVLSGMKSTTFVKRFRRGGQWLFAGDKVSGYCVPRHG